MENIIYSALILGAVVFLIYLWKDKKTTVSTEQGQSLEKKEVFPLRMQAYERLALYLERCRPQSLLLRSLIGQQSVAELQIQLLHNIREEFEHNFSQQIYVSEGLWSTTVAAKDNLIRLVNEAASNAGDTKIFAEKLLHIYANEKHDYIELALQLVRKEARLLQQ